MNVESIRSTFRHTLDDCIYEVYALKCEPEWQLPLLYEPRLSLKSRDYPLTEVPKYAFRHRYYHQATVYDAAVPREKREHIPSWKVFADAANTVYYVGRTEAFNSRLNEHQSGTGSNLTAEATVQKVAIRQQYPQNLKERIVEALADDIDSRESARELAASMGVGTEAKLNTKATELRELRECIQNSRTIVTLEEAAELADDYSLSAVEECVTDARTKRRDAERELAQNLLRLPHSDEGTREINVADIDSFAYWN
ncbi:hypothetical protein [Halapricum salinum]|uniref:GIY-YIG domain-containing protein n=1 Tax=Halapricum salinum TaxID=1457250 RepID=A0A4D6HEI4_9EURY|nr:hypothetical protein [Halapricum salinum]QCC51462.1 hypothetical protein DV733_09515 [Halapricum salinum]